MEPPIIDGVCRLRYRVLMMDGNHEELMMQSVARVDDSAAAVVDGVRCRRQE